jgi:hypothetical protein
MAHAAVEAGHTDASSTMLSRTGGILYLYIILAGLFGEMYVRDRLIVRGDAAATASNILGSETLFRVSVAGELVTCLCDVGLAAILYVLFRPVNRNMSLLAAANRLTFAGVYRTSKFFLVVLSLTQTLSPELARYLFPWVILPAFPAELGLTLWLLFRRRVG